ncbi:MAG TPA: ribonuclease HI [Thermoanaerobaculia bacterium]|nr:ribonuclease HI [Thermoanaerobaculia bacterium]
MPPIPNVLPQVTLYTDGGADPNPGPGGWGAVLLDAAGTRAKELHGGEPKSTNNRMELTAAIRGLEALKQRCRVRLMTDSQYLRRGVTEWLPGWIARGWKRKDGELQNEDLWRRLAELLSEHDIRWDWVKGHAGDRWNERADELATMAIREQRGSGPAPAAVPPPEAEVFLRVSCAGGKGGWAALVRQGGEERVLSGGSAGVTANQLDLLGAAAALEDLPKGAAVAVHTGSDYLRNGATQWIQGWKRRSWKTKEGQPVQNRDLWLRLERAMAARRVHWPAVKDREVPELETLAPVAREAAGRGK